LPEHRTLNPQRSGLAALADLHPVSRSINLAVIIMTVLLALILWRVWWVLFRMIGFGRAYKVTLSFRRPPLCDRERCGTVRRVG